MKYKDHKESVKRLSNADLTELIESDSGMNKRRAKAKVELAKRKERG